MTKIKVIPNLQPWEVMKQAGEGAPWAVRNEESDPWVRAEDQSNLNLLRSFLYLNAAIIQPEPTWPQEGDTLHVVLNGGGISHWGYVNKPIDNAYLFMNNAFRTEAEAIAKRDWLQDPRTHARFLVEQCEGYSVTGKYKISLSGVKGIFLIDDLISSDHQFAGLRFHSSKQATACHTQYPAEVMLLLTGKEAPTP